jgi:3-hydroxymyristoyl/3-hydroxydecanoyl-(acyl carrier protein) dehydratase
MINPNLEFNINQILFKSDEANSFKASWTVPLKLTYFEGHFPEKQILPGVAALDFTTGLINKRLGKELSLVSVKAAKFLRPIQPDLLIDLEFTQKKEGHWRCQWRNNGDLLVNFDLVLILRG